MENNYVGRWILPENLNREIRVGDIVMLETSEDTLVVIIHKITSDNELWHFNNWIIPRKSIVAIKQ